jgi:hypothetical protein
MKLPKMASLPVMALASTRDRLSKRLRATSPPATSPAVPTDDSRHGQDLEILDDFESVVDLVKQRTDLFLRYSEGPHADQGTVSRDYEADVDLPGLSVTTIAPEPWWPRSVEDWVARRICKYDELGEQHGRYPWLLTGQTAATGPDHEPIVEQYEPVARLSPRAIRQAKQWYQYHFDVGKDSTT